MPLREPFRPNEKMQSNILNRAYLGEHLTDEELEWAYDHLEGLRYMAGPMPAQFDLFYVNIAAKAQELRGYVERRRNPYRNPNVTMKDS